MIKNVFTMQLTKQEQLAKIQSFLKTSVFSTLGAWGPLQGYTYLNKAAGLFNYICHLSGYLALKG